MKIYKNNTWSGVTQTIIALQNSKVFHDEGDVGHREIQAGC